MTSAVNTVIPSMWRQELIHPLLAHFPVALIPVSFLFFGLGNFFKKKSWGMFFHPAALVLLGMGLGAGVVSLLTGEVAEDVVNKIICDPTITKSHETFAQLTLATGSIAFLLNIFLLRWGKAVPKAFKPLSVLATLFWLASVGLIMQTGHLGASLVYQQGAATYHPTPECKEFE
jgi:uncharacterized membrane protein